jgi:periplasmic divalent cation tolerance protein
VTSQVLLSYCTCPDESTASTIAEALVAEELAACANQIPGIRSVYRWQGKIEHDEEVLLIIKTTEERFDALVQRLRELHPYDLPEIIAVQVTHGLPDYLQWVNKCTSDDS